MPAFAILWTFRHLDALRHETGREETTSTPGATLICSPAGRGQRSRADKSRADATHTAWRRVDVTAELVQVCGHNHDLAVVSGRYLVNAPKPGQWRVLEGLQSMIALHETWVRVSL